MFRTLIIGNESQKKSEFGNVVWTRHYIKLIKKLNEGGLDSVLVGFLSNEIIEYTKSISFNQRYQIIPIVDILFSKYWDYSWPIIATNMQLDDYYGWYNLKKLLQEYHRYDSNKLIEWMKKYPDTAPQKIIAFIPISNNTNGIDKWTPLILEMFDLFAKNADFISQLSSILHSYFWSGSLIPLLESRKQLLDQIAQHPSIEIKKFASDNIEYFENRIKIEKRNDENETLLK